MLAKAPYRESLPQARYQRNPEKSQTRARCAARLAVATDKRLPMGARCAYALIDDYGGAKGVAWPKIATLAHRLGASRQSVQRWIAALERAGWLTIERTGRASRYTLEWAMRASDEQPGGHRIYICQPVVNEPAAVAPEPAEVEPEERGGPCPDCHDTGTREYWMPAERGTYGRMIPERRWRGRCGCQMVIRRQ